MTSTTAARKHNITFPCTYCYSHLITGNLNSTEAVVTEFSWAYLFYSEVLLHLKFMPYFSASLFCKDDNKFQMRARIFTVGYADEKDFLIQTVGTRGTGKPLCSCMAGLRYSAVGDCGRLNTTPPSKEMCPCPNPWNLCRLPYMTEGRKRLKKRLWRCE